MKSDFEITVEDWIPGDDGEPEVEQAVGEIAISIGGRYATEVEDRPAKTTRHTVRASATLLALWLLSNWWRLRWEPVKEFPGSPAKTLDWELSHSMAASGGGYVWPPLTLSSDGVGITCLCEGQSKSDSESLSPIRYLNDFREIVVPANFESGVTLFVEFVIRRLDSTRIRKSTLHKLWAELTAERSDSAQASRRKLEALLGLDPDEQRMLLTRLANRWQSRVGADALGEIAAAVDSESIAQALSVVEAVGEAMKTYAEPVGLAEIRAALPSFGSLDASVPWQRGRDVARVVRKIWDFGMNPITTDAIADRLRLAPAKVLEPNPALPFSLGIMGAHEEKFKILLSRRHAQGQRFDLARLIGDYFAFDSGDRWKPAPPSLTARQKFQRAFAAEFLCPSDELVRRFDGPLDIDKIDEISHDTAKEFDVSQQIVLNHLRNRGLVSSPVISESMELDPRTPSSRVCN